MQHGVDFFFLFFSFERLRFRGRRMKNSRCPLVEVGRSAWRVPRSLAALVALPARRPLGAQHPPSSTIR